MTGSDLNRLCSSLNRNQPKPCLMFRFLFGDKGQTGQVGRAGKTGQPRKSGRSGKSVAKMRGQASGQMRGRTSRAGTVERLTAPTQSVEAEDQLAARIKDRRARNLRLADAQAALASAGYIPKPDVTGAIYDAKHQVKAGASLADGPEQRAVIERALRLKAAATTIDDALSHPAWRYVAMAVIRGQLEDKSGEDGL